jgi:hypothetical protein
VLQKAPTNLLNLKFLLDRVRLGQGAFAIEKTDNPLETTESESQIRRSGRKRKSVLYEGKENNSHMPYGT